MKNVVLFILGTVFLLLAAFYGFASSPDYKKILTLSLIFDFLSMAVFGTLVHSNLGAPRTIAMLLIFVGLLIGGQSIYRMCMM